MSASSSLPDSAGPAESAPASKRGLLARLVPTLIALGLFATLLRLPHLATSLWIDEGYSIAAARYLNDFDGQRPLYFLLLRGWLKLGQSELWLRLPSVAFGVASVLVCYAAVRKWGDGRTALLAALFMALSAPHVFHSQEVRMYTLATLLLLASAYTLFSWVDGERPRMLGLHALLAYLTLLAFPLTALGLGALWLGAAFQLRNSRRALLWLFGQAALVGLAWLPVARAAAANAGWIAWNEVPGPGELLRLERWAFVADSLYFPGVPQWAAQALLRVIGLTVLGLALFGGLAGRFRLLLLGFGGIVLTVFAVSHAFAPIWLSRYFMPFFPALFVLTAHGLVRLQRFVPVAAYALAGMLLAFEAAGYVTQTSHRPLEDWHHAASDVSRDATGSDIVVVSATPIDPSNTGVWSYYYAGKGRVEYADPPSVEEWLATLKESARRLAPGSRLFLVLRTGALSAPLRPELEQKFTLVDSHYSGVDVFRLVPKL